MNALQVIMEEKNVKNILESWGFEDYVEEFEGRYKKYNFFNIMIPKKIEERAPVACAFYIIF